jgi:hypothetical protein
LWTTWFVLLNFRNQNFKKIQELIQVFDDETTMNWMTPFIDGSFFTFWFRQLQITTPQKITMPCLCKLFTVWTTSH